MKLTIPKQKLITQIIDYNISKNGKINALKGRHIFAYQQVKLNSVDYENAVATFAVQSQSDANRFYGVKLSGIDSTAMQSSCTCPYEYSGLCKHELAAMFYIINELTEKSIVKPPNEIKNERLVKHLTKSAKLMNTINKETSIIPLTKINNDTVQLPSLEARSFLNYISWNDYSSGQQLFNNGNVIEVILSDNKGIFKVKHKQQQYNVTIENQETNNVMLQCNCFDNSTKLCIHKTAALYHLNVRYGIHGLNFLKNWDEEKDKLLSEYGYTLSDDIEKRFEFYYDAKGLNIKLLDASIQKIPGTQAFENWSKTFSGAGNLIENRMPQLDESANTDELIFAFFKNQDGKVPELTFKVIAGKRKKNGEFYKSSLKFYDASGAKKNYLTDNNDEKIIDAARRFNSNFLVTPYKTSSWDNNDFIYRTSLNDKDYTDLQRKVSAGLEQIFAHSKDKFFYLSDYNYNPYTIEIKFDKKYTAAHSAIKVNLVLDEDDEHFILKPVFEKDGRLNTISSYKKISDFIWIKDNSLYKIDSVEDLLLLEKFDLKQELKFRTKDFETLFNTMIKPLSKKSKIEMRKRKQQTIEGLKPAVNLYLKEYDKYLLLMPQFEYVVNDVKEAGELFTKHDLLFTKDDTVFSIKRDLETEQEYETFFKSLHPDFERNLHQEFFHIPFDKVIERGWFFDLFEKLKSKSINVFGQNELKKIKYNYNRPSLKFGNSSGIDWLDLQMQISFGDTDVSLIDIRKAIINKQYFIPLSNGTIGILPEDWVARYAPMFRIGKVEDDTLRLSKLHFTLVDELSSEIDNESLLRELHEKKTKLLEFKDLTHLPIPKNVKAKLRSYQHEGFQWLNFLDEFSWGGCLADDMGLGKTLQVLTFLQHLKNEKRLETCLVVVPTTLIFNWNNEIEKYCKRLKVLTHRGVDREVNHDVFGKYDIVLTTYGTLRSDIADFKEFRFHYIILDESQAIKNPVSQISKAVKLLKAKNRLVMTGTPIENNTFDLYSQLDFLNPGFLGSQEFFRTEFATAIDKYGDENKAAELRKMIAPFVLKRTKEEVAKDLPEKTETILYCEMSKPQRKVYEAFKKKYRDEIMNKIDSEGLSKSGFLILEGLLKLRMICDSPVLVGDADNDFGNDSAKLDELIREINENAGHHKILVFSQFLKMLDLVKQKLEELHIPYQYLDGQTVDRKERVDTFQNDETVRVFLISLKAGGVGINLTEADYVYLVDPWWNPAVERQAIDRTHRIGQKKNVFAYKMICKDTIEEKILLLQEKKKTLASNLIDTEKNIMKKLNKEDIAMLFL